MQYPEFDHALVGLGRTLVALGRAGDALPLLTSALKAVPDSEVAYYQLAQAHRALGNTVEQAQALAEFERLRASAARRHDAPQPRRDVTLQVIEK